MSEETTKTATSAPVDEELNTLWSDFCNKAFKVGQLTLWLEQGKGQIANYEKQLEVALKNLRGASQKHDEYLKKKNTKTPTPAPTERAQEMVQ